MASSGMLRRVALVRTDVSEELNASIIRMTRIGELGTALAVTITDSCHPYDGGVKRRFLQEPHGITSEDAILQTNTNSQVQIMRGCHAARTLDVMQPKCKHANDGNCCHFIVLVQLRGHL
jgi:hypothetical protein